MASPAKRVKLLSGISSESSDQESDSGVKLSNGNSLSFKINEEYAKRFEHNKKREEKDRLEEKFKTSRKRPASDSDNESDGSSTDESEDDDAELATKDLDNEIFATLQAIKEKDPRVYDKSVKFYRDWENEASAPETVKEKKPKPMYLQDYHRQQLIAGHIGNDDEEKDNYAPLTHDQEQAALRKQMVGEMHSAQTFPEDGSEDDDSDSEMFKVKSRPKYDLLPQTSSSMNSDRAKRITDKDIHDADKDPETYLSNFMVSRAWLPDDNWRFEGQEFESDDSGDVDRADAFEEAYNMRFEDPTTANEKLKTFARDAAARSSVRREVKSGRKKAREHEQDKKNAEREEKRKDRERLKKLKMDEVADKVKRIREASGIGKDEELDIGSWRHMLEGDFADDDWDSEMRKRFDEKYYAKKDTGLELDGSDDGRPNNKKGKPRKPKFADDIDINDIVPDFEQDDKAKPTFTLSSDEDGSDNEDKAAAPLANMEIDSEAEDFEKRKTHKERKQAIIDAKRTARKERAKIESLVDSSLPLSHPHLATLSKKTPVAGFRYRETSPTSFGMSARDILFATDADLNSYAGLKKLAAFRDPGSKSKDKKKFSKKARLRQWRKDTFGKPDEPNGGFEKVLGNQGEDEGSEGRKEDNRGKKRKRNGKKAAKNKV